MLAIYGTMIIRRYIPGLDKVLETIKPKLDRLWAQPDAKVPSWATNGNVYNTYPRTDVMDPGGFAHEWPELEDTMTLVNRAINEFYREQHMDHNMEPYVCQMWIHCHKPGADGIEHNHPEMIMSGALYFQCEPYQGNLMIEGQEVVVQTGDLLFWEGNVNHTVLPNSLDKDRIAAAIMVKARKHAIN